MTSTLLIALLAFAASDASTSEEPALQCNLGPTTIDLGGSSWLAYGCADGRSVVFTAEPPNPATPFVFIVTPDGRGGIELHGEGDGAKSASEPAYQELSALSAKDLADVFSLAQQAGGK